MLDIRGPSPAQDGHMAAKKKTGTKKAAKAIAQEAEQLDIEVAAQAARPGRAHPIFHDIERTEALKKTATRKDADIELLRNLLTDADERLAQIHGIVSRTRDALSVGEQGRKDEDIPDAVADLQSKLDKSQVALNEAQLELNANALRLDVANKRAAKLEAEFDVTQSALHAAADERDLFESYNTGLKNDLAAALESLSEAKHTVSELGEVESLATAFAMLVGDEKQRQARSGPGPAIVDLTHASEDTSAAFEAALAVLEAT